MADISDFSFKTAKTNIFDFAVFGNFICLLTVIIAFLLTVKDVNSKILTKAKSFAANYSLTVIILNLKTVPGELNTYWIICVLLPVMMIADYVFFDRKEKIVWLETILQTALIVLLSYVLPLLSELMADGKIVSGFKEILVAAGISGAVFLFLNNIFPAGKNKTADMMANLFRIAYVALQFAAFYIVSGKNVVSFTEQIKNYEFFVNLVCTLFVFVSFILNTAGGESIKDKVFSKMRLYFVFLAITVFIIQIFVQELDLYSGFVKYEFVYVTPAYMVLEWLLMSRKGTARPYEPILLCTVPAGYFAVMIFIFSHSFDFFGNTENIIGLVKWSLIFSCILVLMDYITGKSKI